MLDLGDIDGRAVCLRIVKAVDNLLAMERPDGTRPLRGPFMNMAVLAAFVALSALAITPASSTDILTGFAGVIDGDTIEIAGQRIHLFGIDAPESEQTCRRSEEVWQCGQQAALALSDMIGERSVACEERDRDRHGRIVAKCIVEGNDLSEWLALNGWAVAYVYYTYEHTRAEAIAKSKRRGIWSGQFVYPGDWRHGERLVEPRSGAMVCRIKGNISRSGERIYYVPESRDYDRIRIDLSKGEHWFCREFEARAAGWRRSIRLASGVAGLAGPLHDAAKKGNIEQVKQLIAEGADVNQHDRRTGTALHWAATRGDAEVAKVLMVAGADVNAASKVDSETPLHAAAFSGFGTVAELLLAKGADIEAATTGGLTPLHMAALGDGEAVAQLLLSHGADIRATVRAFGQTALHIAAEHGSTTVMEVLIAAGADVDSIAGPGTTPLHVAVENGHVGAAELLVAHGADINLKRPGGTTPLHEAVERGYDEMAEFLRQRGASE